MNTTHWYIAKLKPGAAREAPVRIITRGPSAGELLHPDREGENIAERSIRDLGLDCYYPRYRIEIIHHRTKKIIVRALPLFATYIFVALPSGNPEWVTDADGIAYVLGNGERLFPVDDDVCRLRRAEADQIFDDTKSARILRRQEGRTERETAELRFPPGTRVWVKNSTSPLADHTGDVLSVTRGGMVRVMVELFGRLTPVEFNTTDLDVLTLYSKAAA